MTIDTVIQVNACIMVLISMLSIQVMKCTTFDKIVTFSRVTFGLKRN